MSFTLTPVAPDEALRIAKHDPRAGLWAHVVDDFLESDAAGLVLDFDSKPETTRARNNISVLRYQGRRPVRVRMEGTRLIIWRTDEVAS